MSHVDVDVDAKRLQYWLPTRASHGGITHHEGIDVQRIRLMVLHLVLAIEGSLLHRRFFLLPHRLSRVHDGDVTRRRPRAA